MIQKKAIHILIAIIAVSVSTLFTIPVHAASKKSNIDAGISTIIIGDSYGEMSYGGTRNGVEIDPSNRNDGYANCWTGRFASKLGLSADLVKSEQSLESKCLIDVFEDTLLYSASGRGFSTSVTAAPDKDADGNIIKTYPRVTYSTMIQEVSSYVEPDKIRWIIVGGGTNDCKVYDQPYFKSMTAQLIESAHLTYPNANIVLAQLGWGKYAEGTLPGDYVRYGDWDDIIQSRVDYLDADLRDVCSDYSYAFYSGNVGKDALAGNEDAFFTGLTGTQYDPVHPNYLGSQAIADCLCERMIAAPISYQCRERGSHDYQFVEGSAVASTCVAAGKESDQKCRVCGDVMTGASIDALEHDFGDWIVDKAPTCTDSGVQSRHCENCDSVTDRQTIPASGHDYQVVEGSAVASTCVAAGKEADQQCTVCGDVVIGASVPAEGHVWKHMKNAAGLLKNGGEFDQCLRCSAKKNNRVLRGFAKSYVKSLKVKNGKKSFTVKWTQRSKVTRQKFNGYLIRYSTKSNMRDARYAIARPSSSFKVIRKLKKKTRYYVQVRTYTKSHGVTYYSSWSKKKTVKTR